MYKFRSIFAEHMENMLAFRVSMGYKETTYIPQLKQLDKFIAEKPNPPTMFSRELVMEWLNQPGIPSVNARNSRAGIARLFGDYLHSVGFEAYVLPPKYTAKQRPAIPYMLTDTELSGFFHAVDTMRPVSHDCLRTYTASVMLRLIYTCGLRPGEGLRLKTENVNLETGEILITETKLQKERLIVMHDDMQKLMSWFTYKRDLSGRDNIYFFPAPSGQPYPSSWLNRIVKNCYLRIHADIPPEQIPNIRAYDLRHRFASAILCRWLDEGRDLNQMLPYLRTYMGHRTLAQTAYYIHILPENLLKSKGIDWDRLNEVIPDTEAFEEWED